MSGRRARMLAAAVALDLLVGEPPARLHPVVWIGRIVAWLEHRAPARGAAVQFLYGAMVTTAVAAGVAASARLALAALRRASLPRLVTAAAEVWLLKSTFAVRALFLAVEQVRVPLAAGRVEEARTALGALVSRETAALTPELIAAAAVESLAENITDSALAPWLAYAVLGTPGAAAYRALNTLDSMIGYRGRYEHLGKVAARADDLANWLPARLAMVLLAMAAAFGRGSPREAWRTARRQHGRTASPNAGWTMAAMAGALEVTLEKTGAYRLGKGPAPTPSEIRRAEQVAGGALTLGLLSAIVLTYAKEERDDGR